MRIGRIAAMAAVVAGTSVGLASPAFAEVPSGSYTAEGIAPDGSASPLTNSPWVLTPCGPDCTSSGDREFRLEGNTWTNSKPAADGMPCRTTFDATTLTGLSGCGGMEFPIKLTKTG